MLATNGRTPFYLRRDNFRARGPSALRTRCRPGKSVVFAKAPVVATDDLSLARQRIAELERKVGQQQLELDFFNKPCGKSRQNAGRSTSLAQSHLRRHRSDDRYAARRAHRGALVCHISFGRCRLLSSLPGLRASPGRDERPRCNSAHRAQEPILWLSEDPSRASKRGLSRQSSASNV